MLICAPCRPGACPAIFPGLVMPACPGRAIPVILAPGSGRIRAPGSSLCIPVHIILPEARILPASGRQTGPVSAMMPLRLTGPGAGVPGVCTGWPGTTRTEKNREPPP